MQQVGAPHRERIDAHFVRHLIEQTLECEAHVDGAVAAECAAGRRVGQHALADILDVLQVIDRVQHRAGIENRDHAVAGMRAAALDRLAFDAGDAAILLQADPELDVGLRPAAMGDEGLLAVDHGAHDATGLAGQQCGDQFDIQRLGAAAEAAADMRLDHADARHIHLEDVGQHHVHVIRHLGRGMHGDAVAHRVVIGDRGVHLHLHLADFRAIIDALAHQIGIGERVLDIAEFEEHVAFEIAGLLLVQLDGIGRHRGLRGVIAGQFAHRHLDATDRLARGGVIDRSHRRHRLAAIADTIARQRMFAAGDRQHAEGLVAIGAGDDRLHAWNFQRLGDIDVENLGM